MIFKGVYGAKTIVIGDITVVFDSFEIDQEYEDVDIYKSGFYIATISGDSVTTFIQKAKELGIPERK